MGSTETLTQKWLRQNIQSYANRDTVFAHVDAVLLRHPTIRPKTDVYTYDDGRTQLLLCLHGLLPISFRGASYNIPIAVWLTREYPRQPPIAYVVPTSDMLVRASADVDVSGRCHIEYLYNWDKKCEGCSLVELIEAMQDIFSRVPPVYAKPTRPSSSQSAPRPHVLGHDYSARPPPPLPGTSSATTPQPASPSNQNEERPPLPAKPGTSATPYDRAPSVPPQRPRHNSRDRSPVVFGNTDLEMRPPPPLPPHPPIAPGISSYSSSPIPPIYTPRSSSASIETATIALPSSSNLPRAPATPVRAANHHLPMRVPHAAYLSGPSSSSPPPVPPVPHSILSQPFLGPERQAYSPPVSPAESTRLSAPQPLLPPPFVSSPPFADSHPLRRQIQHAAPPPTSIPPPAFSAPLPLPLPAPSNPPPDLLDADDAAVLEAAVSPPSSPTAPPRPPNPELLRLHAQVHAKMQSELASLSHVMALDAERLRAHQADLLAGEPAIRDEMARLEAVRDVCLTVADRMRAVVDAGTQNVAELRRKGDPEVDELVCSTTIVHNQLINLVAEDNAIEDTIYHLHRALNTGRIDLERFIRTARVLAEEQFTKRALIEKIQAGLPQDDSDAVWSVPPGWHYQ
ncbi:UEV-domain-containing protein [Laetiporus sulphureus 93-53]|uniref:UEV-domain-containing protein n=1 Tax=Laetiporus sulphureus 93-53 TaxID=1314785 RepID=A0A165H873_9APHY|nr:UEV-domain-containing protein [Laetiporus sulphureus 93-53]KZT11380.1 UEV-domain-containing protein [Laetiporus sulphureus 93-53]